MGFWSGFEGLTGHRPGAFKGFRLKDIIDKDLWERKQRTWSGKMLPQGATEAERQRDLRFSRGGEPMMTNWYKGRGAVAPLNANERRVSDLMRDQGMQTVQNIQPNAVVSRARPWPNLQAQMLRDPLRGVGGMRIPPAELMGRQPPPAFSSPMRPEGAITGPRPRPFQMSDMTIPPAELMGEKTTVKKVFADPTKSDTVTETIKEKVPMGNMRIPTSELMGARSLAPRRQPTSIMDMMIPIGELMEMRRRRDQMRFRQNPYHMLRRSY